ncbi:MAG: Cytochrome c6 [Anaerolineae bacterium]|nr:Cytochrome c6 [Anaerolineae bacterium]
MANRRRQVSESKGRTIAMLLTFGLIFVGVVVFVIRPTVGTPSQAGADPVTNKGKVLYDAYCAACHGANGEAGVVPNSPALNADGEMWHRSDEELLAQMRHGGENMPAMAADFTDEQVTALLTYIKGWWTPKQRAVQIGDIGE